MTRCCEAHREADCCDPRDCGPCCADCPSCPTLREQRRTAMPRAVASFGGVIVTVCDRIPPDDGIYALRRLLDEAKVNPASVRLDGDVGIEVDATPIQLSRLPGAPWAPVS